MIQEMSIGGFIAILVVGGFLAMGLFHIVGTFISDSLQARNFELSRREIAAYVAEGSIAPADAERLISAGRKRRKTGSTSNG